MRERIRSNLIISISAFTLFVGCTALLFGDNLYERFIRSKIIMISSKEQFELPEKINKFIKDNDWRRQLNTLPNAMRMVTIRNNGSPSRNLNICLDLDGGIFQYKVISTEIIANESMLSNKLNISLSRLSKNAEIFITFWIREENYPFKCTFVDDNTSGSILNTDEPKTNSPIANIVIVVVLAIALILIFRETGNRLIQKMSKQSRMEVIQAINEIGLNTIEEKQGEAKRSTENIDEIRDRLSRMVKAVNK